MNGNNTVLVLKTSRDRSQKTNQNGVAVRGAQVPWLSLPVIKLEFRNNRADLLFLMIGCTLHCRTGLSIGSG